MTSLIKNAWNKLQYKAFQATYDPEANKYVQEEAQAAALSPNARAWNNYKKMWGDRAVASGQIDPKYYGSYSSIIAVPVPVDSEKEYNAAADTLANMIATWYVNSKYSGDLVDLGLQIQTSKPRYEGQKKDTNGRPVAPKPPAKPKTTRQLFMSGFFSTFFGILIFVVIFFLCILAGSLAANDAIGRSAAIRVVSFLYAVFPIFSPFVLGYYIYRYYKGTYPLYYNMLPLTTSPGTSWIIQVLKWPFYYVKDANSEFQTEQFIRLGKALVFSGASVSVNKPYNAANDHQKPSNAPQKPANAPTDNDPQKPANNVVNIPSNNIPANNVANAPANNAPANNAPTNNAPANAPANNAPANNAPTNNVAANNAPQKPANEPKPLVPSQL